MRRLIACGAVCVLLGAQADPEARPYEFVWANRTADEFPPVCRLASADGWTAEGSNAEAKISATGEHILFDDTSLRLDYRATGRDPTIRLCPSKPVRVPDGFDTATLWVYGNNIWGKVGGGNTNAVPSLKIVAEFTGADGKPFELSLGSEKHRGWFLMTGVVTDGTRQAAAPSGLRFTGFRITGGTNRDFNSICLTSFAVFADPKRPLELKPRPRRGVRLFPDAPQGLNVGEGKLPFPNTPRTVLPPSRTLSGKLEFRLPKDPLVWDDLAFRYAGSDWVRLAVGGGLFPKGGVAGAKVTFHRDGNSLVCDIVRPGPGVESVRFGAMDLPKGGVSCGWPFYTGRYASGWDCPAIPEELSGRIRPKTAVFKLGGRRLVVAATFDWTQSNASSPIGWKGDPDGQVRLNGGVMYLPKTDGVRNGCFERFVWTFGEKVEDVLPTIPNPPSPYRRETAAGSWTSCHAFNREADAAYWRAVKKAGLSHVIITDHESGWRDGDESFTLRTRTAPKKGGDASQLRYARILIDELGFRYGPYNNFTDYAPVNAHWSLDCASRYPNGSLGDAWYRCYKPKPTWAVGMCEKLTPQIQGKFGFNTAYCDVHTCVTPWNRTDYDARSPGAATFAQTFYAYGEIMLIQKANWKGPVYSEGNVQWLYAGLTDGNYGQDEEYDFGAEPWLVDFDLRRIHPLENTFGIGAPYMFYRRTNGRLVQPETDVWADRFTAATLAFGHAGYFYSKRKPDDLTWERKFYYPVQAIAARYGVADAVEIRYGAADGGLLATEDALARGAVSRNQVRVAYSDGTVVAANGSMTEAFPVSVLGEDVVLPPNGWYARTKDGDVVTYCLEKDGRRVHYAKSPEYEERW